MTNWNRAGHRTPFLALFCGSICIVSPSFAAPSLDQPLSEVVFELNAHENFDHSIGRPGSAGWQLDYQKDKPGLALTKPREPIHLDPGFYRISFLMRRGHYPKKGLFHKTFPLFRLELLDSTQNQIITKREIQIGDFSEPNQYEPRWMEFNIESPDGSWIEPRVFWLGLGNGEIASVKIEQFISPSLRDLEDKAVRLGEHLEKNHLENGFVVSRKKNGEADETGDATTYTGFYVASLAWKYAVTKDPLTLQSLENALWALHNSLKGDIENPILTRFVEEDGTPFSKSPSKDVYTSFFLAYAAAFPHLQNESLKKMMAEDADRLATKLLKEGLVIRGGNQILLSLTPYFTDEEVKNGIQKLLADKRATKKAIKGIKTAQKLVPFGDPIPHLKEIIHALEHQDGDKLFSLVVPTMNSLVVVVERVRDLLREQYRSDLFPRRLKNRDIPGRQLLDLVNITLKKLPLPKEKNRFQQLSDLRILASNALLSLHIIRTSFVLSQNPALDEYYKTNLHTQDQLVKTALDWYGFEEDFLRLTMGNHVADQERRGYLTMLGLYNLFELESNPSLKSEYVNLFDRERLAYEHEDNPLVEALSLVMTKKGRVGLILRDLELYPEDRTGFGIDYWKENGATVSQKWGGGEGDGYSREALPISLRPKDSFLWQRNARRLKGDEVKDYPGTDYLFLYWFCRYHNILPNPATEPTVLVK